MNVKASLKSDEKNAVVLPLCDLFYGDIFISNPFTESDNISPKDIVKAIQRGDSLWMKVNHVSDGNLIDAINIRTGTHSTFFPDHDVIRIQASLHINEFDVDTKGN